MDTWVIVLIVVAVVVVLALAALALARRNRVTGARKREQARVQAREHLQEAQLRGAQAEKEQAIADEQAARARRERAEADERLRLAEQEAQQRAAAAQEHRSTADELTARAEELAPGLGGSTGGRPDAGVPAGDVQDPHHADGRPEQPTGPDQPSGGATRR